MIARTSVGQSPFNGSFYPLAVRDDVAEFLLDFYLSYVDDGYVLPFRVVWLYGFGDTVNSLPSGMPTPVNTRDFLLVDAQDQVVFDSTTATYLETTWGSNRVVSEWRTTSSVARVVTDETDRAARLLHIEPESGELDGRVLNRLPKRVNLISALEADLTGNVRLRNGYNVRLVPTADDRVDGGRFRNRIQVQCAPGIGLGRAPGCNEDLPVLRSINGQIADDAGNLFLSADDCARLQLIATGGTYGGHGLSETQAKSALFIDDDCDPCCPCSFYVNTYKGLKRMHSRWRAATQELESIRDLYRANRDRWNLQQECRTDNALTMVCTAEESCSVVFLANYCNVTFSCLPPVELRLALSLYENGIDVTSEFAASHCFQAYIKDSSRQSEEPFVFAGTWPNLVATFPFLSTQDSGTLRFRLCVEGCRANMTMTATLTVHYADPEPPYNGVIVPIPNLGDGSAYGSAYTTRGVRVFNRPIIQGSSNCGCS